MKTPRIWIDTDIKMSEPDDMQSLIHAVMLHAAGRIEIAGITIGAPRGNIELVKKVLMAARKDGLSLGGLGRRVYRGITKPGSYLVTGAVQQMVEAVRADSEVRVLGWGSATNIAAMVRNYPDRPKVHLIASWNREQDPNAHKIVVEAYSKNKNRLYVNETDFRRMYVGWPREANRKFVRKIRDNCGHLGKLFYSISEGVNTGSHTIKMGDTPSVQWAIEGAKSTFVTRRVQILNDWTTVMEELYATK
jgi:inosine-uridine nucleoside N-ribohydrolase